MRDDFPGSMWCMECGMKVQPANAYHPFLYCELFKLGHRDPAKYLRDYGFERIHVDRIECRASGGPGA